MRVLIVEKYNIAWDRYFPIKVFKSKDVNGNFAARLDVSVTGLLEKLYSNSSYSNVSVKVIWCFERERFALYNVFYNIGDKRYANAYSVFEMEMEE